MKTPGDSDRSRSMFGSCICASLIECASILFQGDSTRYFLDQLDRICRPVSSYIASIIIPLHLAWHTMFWNGIRLIFYLTADTKL